MLGFVSTYRFMSSFFSPKCRFQPSCSEYAQLAIKGHGPWTGVKLTMARISKCHPFHEGGIDPVPPPKTRSLNVKRPLSSGISHK
ncbi:MAG: membrane protein insertion efficiency factor YidD [Actinomycetota bacterium]